MEVIEDGNIMDRIPILLQRDLEYYQNNQTVLSEKICAGVVGGRLDFPRSASFAAVKIVLWLEEEFSIAFKQGSGMFVKLEDDNIEVGVAKTSDPDKFVQLAIKSSDMLLEHLHTLVQEALDHADLPVLTATLGASALLKNSLYCYLQHVEDTGVAEMQSAMQACYKRYVTMSEAVAERVLDLHNRVVSLYVVQDAGGRRRGAPSVQGWWLYMNGCRKDLWSTAPPRTAQRIFAGMLNETLIILTVRYCQTNTTDATTPHLVNDIINILSCSARLLASVCSNGAELCGIGCEGAHGGAHGGAAVAPHVRDAHAKCTQLFHCAVYRAAPLHTPLQAFKEKQETLTTDGPYPWFMFVSPHLFDNLDVKATSSQDLPDKTAIGLEIMVLLAQPQPSWELLLKALVMRQGQLLRGLLVRAVSAMSADNGRWPARGLWCGGTRNTCSGVLCTADGFCTFQGGDVEGEEYARTAGALTYVIASIGSKDEVKSTLCYALEISGTYWAACLDKRQVWCDRRPPWLAGVLALVGTSLEFIPPLLVEAIQTGSSMYQTMSLCLTCISRTLQCLPKTFFNATEVIQNALPANVNPVGGSVAVQMLITVAYEETIKWAEKEAERPTVANRPRPRPKQVKIISLQTTTSSSISFDGYHSSPTSIALAVAEALCSVDEEDKHTAEINSLVQETVKTFQVSDLFGLDEYPEFAEFLEEGSVSASNAEKASDAAALTSQILMTSAGRDSLRVIYDHIQKHQERIYKELGIQEKSEIDIATNNAPLLYTMFHIGKQPFDQYFRGECPMPWTELVSAAKSRSGVEGAKVHINRRTDIRNIKNNSKNSKQLLDLYAMFKSQPEGLL